MRTATTPLTSSPASQQSLGSRVSEHPSSRWLFVGAAVAAVVVFLAAYSNSFRNGFHFDDIHVVVDNVFIRDLANLPRFFTDARTSTALPQNAVYRPLVTLTLATDYWLAGGLNPPWFHVTQLAFFLTVGVMLFFLYSRLFASTGVVKGSGWPALFAAALFCVHTANAETGNYITARSELISGCGVLGAFLLYIYAPGSRRFYWFLIPVAAGVLAKTPAVMFAPLLLAYVLFIEEQLSLGDIFSTASWPRVRCVLVRVAPVFVIAVGLYLFAEGMNPPTVDYGGVGRMRYLSTQTWVWPDYLRQFFIPTGLSADTDLEPFTTWADPRVLPGVLLLALSLVAIWYTSRTRGMRPVAFGIAWFWIALFPSSSIFPLAEVKNGHRAFFPFMGLTAAVVWWLAVRLRSVASSASRQRWVAVFASASAVLVIGAHAIATHARNRVWLSDETLWADVVKKSPNNNRGLMNYGLTQMAQGRYDVARDHFIRALALSPNYPLIHVNLGIVSDAMGDSASAEPFFQRALTLDPNSVDGHFFYARWLVQQGRAADAIPHLERAIALSPAALPARHALLDLYAAEGEVAKLSALIEETLTFDTSDSFALEYSNITASAPSGTAEEWFQRGLTRTSGQQHAPAAAAYRVSLALDSRNADAWNNLGWALGQLGSYEQAIDSFERAIELRPDFLTARNNLAWAKGRLMGADDNASFAKAFQLQTTGQAGDAVGIYRELLARNPGWVNAHYNLGHALMTLGDCPGAIAELERTLALQPDYPLAHLHLSTCLGRLGRSAESEQHRAIYDQSLRESAPASPGGA